MHKDIGWVANGAGQDQTAPKEEKEAIWSETTLFARGCGGWGGGGAVIQMF